MMQVTYFHRKPRQNANFSIEGVFEGVRRELDGQIDSRVCVAPCLSNGILRRLWIVLHARRHQGEINHVTGDTNFTAILLDGQVERFSRIMIADICTTAVDGGDGFCKLFGWTSRFVA